MNFFANLGTNIKEFFCPPPGMTRYERRMKEPAKPLVWNDESILLDTHGDDGDHIFAHFSGHIICRQTDCEVQDASFKFHAGAMCFLAGQHPSPGIWPAGALLQNWLEWKGGTLLSGRLCCRCWENGTVMGGELACDRFETGSVNGGVVNCSEWRGGIVNNGEIRCGIWLCGTFNCGTLQGAEACSPVKWKDGIFNGGTFNGEWYGGIWNGGTWKGKALVGDGTFEWISNNRKSV